MHIYFKNINGIQYVYLQKYMHCGLFVHAIHATEKIASEYS